VSKSLCFLCISTYSLATPPSFQLLFFDNTALVFELPLFTNYKTTVVQTTSGIKVAGCLDENTSALQERYTDLENVAMAGNDIICGKYLLSFKLVCGPNLRRH